MSKFKLSSVILYVVVAISLVVMLFFYVAPRTLNIEELENRVEELTTAEVVQINDNEAVIDSTAVESTATEEGMETDSAAIAPVVEETPPAEEVAAVEEIDLRDHLTGWELMVWKRTDYALGWAYILLLITGIASLVFPLIYLATNLKAAIRVLAVIAAAAVLILISYFVFASDIPIQITGYLGTENSDPGVLKMIDTALYSTYVLFGLAIISILYSEVANLFK